MTRLSFCDCIEERILQRFHEFAQSACFDVGDTNRRDILPLGEMAEWSMALASKASRPLKGLEGSNPSLSARHCTNGALKGFTMESELRILCS